MELLFQNQLEISQNHYKELAGYSGPVLIMCLTDVKGYRGNLQFTTSCLVTIQSYDRLHQSYLRPVFEVTMAACTQAT